MMIPIREEATFSQRMSAFLQGWQNRLSLSVDALRAKNPQQSEEKLGHEPFPKTVNLQEVIQSVPDLPPHSLIIGADDNGMPFVLDFTDPTPGSILIAGDRNSGKSALLHAMLTSAIHLNSPESLQFNLLAEDIDKYLDVFNAPQCQSLRPLQAQRTQEILNRIVEIAEERRQKGIDTPSLLLCIDDLITCLLNTDTETHRSLFWLFKHGPKYRLWTIATLSTERLKELHMGFLGAFQTIILSHINNKRMATALGGPQGSIAQKLPPGEKFALSYGDSWVPFSPLSFESDSPELSQSEEGENNHERRDVMVR